MSLTVSFVPILVGAFTQIDLTGGELPTSWEGRVGDNNRPVRMTFAYRDIAANLDSLIAIGVEDVEVFTDANGDRYVRGSSQGTAKAVRLSHVVTGTGACTDTQDGVIHVETMNLGINTIQVVITHYPCTKYRDRWSATCIDISTGGACS